MSWTSISATLSARGGLGYLAIHAVQFGAQPLLARTCIASGTPASSLVLGAEVAKFIGCMCMLHVEGRMREALKGWSLKGSLLAAGIPAVTYLVQNTCTQIAYQNLDGVVFNILNQTKMVFTALFSYFLVGRRQSPMQCLALAMVMLAGALISISEKPVFSPNGHGPEAWALGTSCILASSFFSGLGSGIVEWTLQRKKRDSYLFTAEMAVLGCMIIVSSLPLRLTADSETWHREGLFARWSFATTVPILTQGWGGIVVGLITKVAGGVRKGFAVIVGLLLTCFLKWAIDGERISPLVCIAVPLVAASIWLHASFPPGVPAQKRA